MVWFHDRGYGYSPPEPNADIYDSNYLLKYDQYATSDLGRRIVDARREWVDYFYHGPLLDFGCANQAFVMARKDTSGYDILPGVRERLGKRWLDPYVAIEPIEAMSFWDSLEHLSDPWDVLSMVHHWVFLSIPIFKDADHCRSSKHFRPGGEHQWYFTDRGLLFFMEENGFTWRASSQVETLLGREDIGTYAFERQRWPLDAATNGSYHMEP